MKIKFAKCHPNAIIPSKRQQDAGFDIYILNNHTIYTIQPHHTTLLPTGLKSIIEPGYYVQLQERGSTGSKGIKYGAGVIDSNYRGEWFLAVTNSTDKILVIGDEQDIKNNSPNYLNNENVLIYNINKALFQGVVHKVPVCDIEEVSEEEINQDITDRGEGKLGSSGK